MNRSIHAFILLSAYLLMLVHGMIPHHHHAEAEHIIPSQTAKSDYPDVDKHVLVHHDHGHPHDHHHHSESHEKPVGPEPDKGSTSHGHSFPWHSHSLAENEAGFTRTSLLQFDIKNIIVLNLYLPGSNLVSSDAGISHVKRRTHDPIWHEQISVLRALAPRAPPCLV